MVDWTIKIRIIYIFHEMLKNRGHPVATTVQKHVQFWMRKGMKLSFTFHESTKAIFTFAFCTLTNTPTHHYTVWSFNNRSKGNSQYLLLTLSFLPLSTFSHYFIFFYNGLSSLLKRLICSSAICIHFTSASWKLLSFWYRLVEFEITAFTNVHMHNNWSVLQLSLPVGCFYLSVCVLSYGLRRQM